MIVFEKQSKYEIRICKCGTIHFIPEEKIDKALEEDKELLWICGSCGQGTRIGGDREPNIYDEGPDAPEWIFNMYSIDFNPNTIHETLSISAEDFTTTDKRKGFSEIFYSTGIKVPMMSGMNAKQHNGANRYFLDIWWPDWYKIEGSDMTKEDILEFISKYKEDCKKVNMGAFIRQTPEEFLQILARTWMDEFDWTGTPYEKIHNDYINRIKGITSDEE